MVHGKACSYNKEVVGVVQPILTVSLDEIVAFVAVRKSEEEINEIAEPLLEVFLRYSVKVISDV